MKPEPNQLENLMPTAVLIGVINKQQNEDLSKEYLE